MSRAIVVACLALLALGVAPAPASADGPPGTLRVEDVDVDEHPWVEVTVVAPHELADESIEASDIRLAEGGREREVEVSRLTGSGQELVLAIDVSGSMEGEPLAAARAAASALVERAPDGMRIGLVAFGDGAEVLAEPSTEHEALLEALAGLRADGRTALYDGVANAIGLFGDEAGTTRTVVVLADGEDNASAAELGPVRRRLADHGVTAYSVLLDTSATDRSALESLVEGTGGAVATADDPSELASVYDVLATDVGNRYLLRYRSGEHGPTDLEVAVDAHGVQQRVAGHPLPLPEPGMLGGLLQSAWVLVGGLVLCYVALVVFVTRVVAPRLPRVDLGGNPSSAPQRSGLAGLAERVAIVLERGLRRRGALERLATALDLAGIRLRPGEAVLLTLSGALCGAAVGVVLSGPVLAVVLAAVVLVLAKVGLGFRTTRRRAKFADQLDSTLQLLAGSLRAGHSLMQAVDAVSDEAASPTSEEFQRLVNATRVGQDLGTALATTVERTGSEDFAWVSQAIAIHREVGGDLAEVLDTVGETIRERNQIRRQVKALSAEGKLSAIVLMALPIGILAFLSVTNPSYLANFTAGLVGYAMLTMVGVLMLSGGLWLRKLVQIRF